MRKRLFDRASQGEAVGRDDAHVTLKTFSFSSKFLGSTMVELMLVKILNSRAQRMS